MTRSCLVILAAAGPTLALAAPARAGGQAVTVPTSFTVTANNGQTAACAAG